MKTRSFALGLFAAFLADRPSTKPGGSSLSSTSRGNIQTLELTRSKPWVALSLGNLQPDHVWQVVLIDEQGRAFPNQGSFGSGGCHFCDFEVPETNRRAKLRFVLQRMRKVSFTVAPPPPETP